MPAPRKVEIKAARRLALHAQRLNGAAHSASADALHELMTQLGCLQLDPTSAVAPSHLLVLWSRLGTYDQALVDRLLWEERRWFEYWAHAASIVPTADYPIHSLKMRRSGRGDTPWDQRVRNFMETNAALRRSILVRLRRNGPLPARAFEDMSQQSWQSSGWTNERNVGRMIDFLWMAGRVFVSRRRGRTRLWDIAERVLPDWTPRERLSQNAVVGRSVVRALRALGVASATEINRHFTRGRYPNLPRVMERLERRGEIQRVDIGLNGGPARFIHTEDVETLGALERSEPSTRTSLLSPFDNLICDRERTAWLFGFDFKLEIYTPAPKRRYGFFVMPVLHEGALIGRIDPKFDRVAGALIVNSVHLEPSAPSGRRTAQAVSAAVNDLATFLGAGEVRWPSPPASWKRWLG
jgi:hypothetical protein